MNRSFEARLMTIFMIGVIYACGRLALTLTAAVCGFAMLDPELPR